jgi:hypothetical protein
MRTTVPERANVTTARVTDIGALAIRVRPYLSASLGESDEQRDDREARQHREHGEGRAAST